MAPRSSWNHGRQCNVGSCAGDGNNTGVPITPFTPSTSSDQSTTTVFMTHTYTIPPNVTTTITQTPASALVRSNSAVLSNGAIVGISVGGSAFLILVFVLGILLRRYRRRKRVQEVKYTPWSRLNSDRASSDSPTATTTRSRPSNAVSVLEIPIPTHYLFDSPVSIRPPSNPFRTSQTIDGRTLLKSLVLHDRPVPQLPTQQHYSSAYYEDVLPSPRAQQQRSFTASTSNMPVLRVTSSSNSSPSVYDSDSAQDVDEISHRAVDSHTAFVTPGHNITPTPVSLQPRPGLGRNPAQVVMSNKLPSEVLPSPPPPAVTRSRSHEARAIAELIRAIDSPSPLNDDTNRRVSTLSSKHTSVRSETDGSIGIALTTPFASSSLYASGDISSRSSMTNTFFQRLTADFPLPPETNSLPSNFSHS